MSRSSNSSKSEGLMSGDRHLRLVSAESIMSGIGLTNVARAAAGALILDGSSRGLAVGSDRNGLLSRR